MPELEQKRVVEKSEKGVDELLLELEKVKKERDSYLEEAKRMHEIAQAYATSLSNVINGVLGTINIAKDNINLISGK